MRREVLLLGSLPLRPAEAVFDAVARHLGTLAPRIPDGEQIGWSSAARRTFHQHPMLEVHRYVALNAGGRDPVEIFRLKDGFAAKDLKLGPYGYVENAKQSYAAFKSYAMSASCRQRRAIRQPCRGRARRLSASSCRRSNCCRWRATRWPRR